MIGEALEDLYNRYNSREFVEPDPLSLLFRYDDVRDREIAGLISSSLAFGNVSQIISSAGSVLRVMGDSPSKYILKSRRQRMLQDFEGFRHRWTGGADLINFLDGIKTAVRKFGSLEKCFASGYSAEDKDIVPALTSFVREVIGPGKVNRLVPCPSRGSACKRLNLFLRWMIRSDRVDPGGWDTIPPSKLLVPVDVHMHRFSTLLGLTSRRQADLRTAREITERMKAFSPGDPVKYDFALTRLGIRRDDDRGRLLARLGIDAGMPGDIGLASKGRPDGGSVN